MQNEITTLSVSHNLFLTKEQRYDLYNGKDIEIIGVSTPVWLHRNKTSEPAVEVFAKYKLFNRKERIHISHDSEGFKMTIPPAAGDHIEDIKQQLAHTSAEEIMLLQQEVPCLKDLLDLKDGGSAWMAFQQNSHVNKDKRRLLVVHSVEIKDVQELVKSLM